MKQALKLCLGSQIQVLHLLIFKLSLNLILICNVILMRVAKKKLVGFFFPFYQSSLQQFAILLTCILQYLFTQSFKYRFFFCSLDGVCGPFQDQCEQSCSYQILLKGTNPFTSLNHCEDPASHWGSQAQLPSNSSTANLGFPSCHRHRSCNNSCSGVQMCRCIDRKLI